MTVVSTIYRVEALTHGRYGEIVERHECPGGEAMNAALLLSGLGESVCLAGPHWGYATERVLQRYAERLCLDVSGVTRSAAFEGVRDVVIVDGAERTVLGWFGRYFSEPHHHWDEPEEAQIAQARVIAIDPYFGSSSELAARYARLAHRPYVTIDCPFDSELHAGAAVNVLSREYRRRTYMNLDDADLFARYAATTKGLTVFTSGSDPITFGRAGKAPEKLQPFAVSVKSTLGAGDCFRAGMVLGLLRGYADAEAVRLAAGLAALMCTRLPIADNLPTCAELTAYLAGRT